MSVLVCSIFFTVRFLEQENRRGKGTMTLFLCFIILLILSILSKVSWILDRMDRIFKIRGVLGFVCLFLQYFLHGEVFGTRKQKGKGHNHAFPVSHNSVNSVN